jgi:putative tricarboxylic transport membrane protein
MRAEYISSALIVAISFLACIGAGKLGIGKVGSPGPGFFPFVLGSVTGGLSLAVIVRGLWKRRRGKTTEAPPRAEAGGLIKIACILAALVGYGLLLEKIGYVFTTFIVFGFLLRVVDTQKWRFVVGGAIVVAVVSYILFDWLLGVPLPKGALGI